MCGGLWASVIYSVSLLEYRSLSADRHWRISREYRGLSRRNAMDSTRYSSVVSPCPTQGPLFSHGECAPKFFNWVVASTVWWILFTLYVTTFQDNYLSLGKNKMKVRYTDHVLEFWLCGILFYWFHLITNHV